MSVIFSATKASYNISGLAGLAIFNPGFSLMVKMHIMTEDIFFVILFRSKYFCIRAGDTKKRSFFNHFHNPHFAHAEHQRHQKTFFGHHILHNPYNWNILFFSFSHLVQKQVSIMAQHPNFSIQISQTVNSCSIFATCNRNTYICLLLPNKACNSQGKGIWLRFCLWHDHKRDMFSHNNRRTLEN